MEALRLSLTNLHTAQLELTQSNLQKEKEAALSELQASLREKWAQECAMLQTRQQFELERLREQSREQEKQAELQQQLVIGEARKYTAQLLFIAGNSICPEKYCISVLSLTIHFWYMG